MKTYYDIIIGVLEAQPTNCGYCNGVCHKMKENRAFCSVFVFLKYAYGS